GTWMRIPKGIRSLQLLILFALLAVFPPLAASDASAALDMARQLNEAFVAVAEKVSPAVVVIDVAEKASAAGGLELHPWFESLPEEWKEQYRRELERRADPNAEPEFGGHGSGMILSTDGDVLTNYHVVAGAERIRVRLRDGRQLEAAIRGTDADSDLAVLRLQNPPKDLPVVTFGDSDRVRVGEFAIAIGAPYQLDYSISFGHISAKGRSDLIGGLFDQAFLQTDANINPGNSGGPLVDIEGRVIGVNSMIRNLNSGIGFAIPSNLAREISSRLREDGRFVRSWLGIGIESLRNNERVRRRVPDLERGVVVTAIAPEGPSSRSEPRLKSGDVITAVDGRVVADPNELRAQISRKRPGSTVILDVRREDQALKVRVEPVPLPDQQERVAMMRGRRGENRGNDPAYGLQVEALDADAAKAASVEGGVRVTAVAPESPGAEQELQPGDLITEVNHTSVESPAQFQSLLKEANLSKGILLQVRRNGEDLFKVLKPRP
ncbi:MAG: trypsin-like peptidase domain-containing protein, partial [Verrucomicrobiae bacterium]|nr:trypsin-like peptidase domain-containing protein [Verrucomicrobiae bacterium]